ncbi:MAG: hypothetical protein O3B41_08535 [Bacteroidetes bacterium]|nr:hypothetical protein [Bacteroidota bacterium]
MPKSFLSYALLLFFAFILLVPVYAQETPQIPAALPADVESVDAIIAAVYDVISGGMGVERDWNRFRSLFHPEAKLIPSGCNAQGQCRATYWTVGQYVERAGPSLTASGFFEAETHRLEERFGNIAHIFSTYDSRRTLEDAEPFQRGINSIQLFNDGSRWWVVNIFWQGAGPNSPIPAKYQGK